MTNKMILRNPIPTSDELTLSLYKKAHMPLSTYFETIAALAIRGCYNTCLEIIKDKVNMDNIEEALFKFQNFIKPWHKDNMNQEMYDKVLEILMEINSDILINLFINKDPYKKRLTNDKIVNLTGQSGAGKSTYAMNRFNSKDYLVVDTDDIFSDIKFEHSVGINRELGEYFRNKYQVLPDCFNNFDLIYQEIINYCQKYDKTIVIDCTQFHCIKDISLLKGEIIIIRTCINDCYNRTIERYKKIVPNYTEDELKKYQERKKKIFDLYKFSNKFIQRINDLTIKKIIISKKGENMKLVTFQSLDAVNDLFKKGYLECDDKKIDIKKVGTIYNWVIDKMNEKMSNNTNTKYPLWCWVKCYNGIYPPKRKGKKVEGFDVKITFHKKEEDVFITDFRRYSFLLNNMYIPYNFKEKEQFDKILKDYKITKEDLRAYVRKDKYNKHRTDEEYMKICRMIQKSFDRCITKDSNILQGCVWRINLDEIEKIEFLKDDGFVYGSLNYIRSNGKRMDWQEDYYSILK